MSQFQYAPYDSSKYLGTIADLLQEPGRAQARAAEIGGAAKAQALQQTGQGIAGAAQYAFDPRRKIEALQLQEAAQKVSDLRALDAAFQQPGGREAIISNLPGHLRPTVTKQFDEQDKLHAEAQKFQEQANALKVDAFADAAAQVRAHGNDPMAAQLALSDLKTKYVNDPQTLQQIQQYEQQLHANPTADTVKGMTDGLIQASPKRAELENKAAELQRQIQANAETQRHNQATETQATATLAQTASHNAATERIAGQQAATAAAREHRERDVYNQTYGQGLGPDGKPLPVSPQAQAIADYRMPPISPRSMASGPGRALMDQVMRANPGYDATNWQNRQKTRVAFTTGTQGQQINAMNTAIGHLEQFTQMADSLKNGDFKPGNAIYNRAKELFGSAAPTNFETLKEFLDGELGAIVKKGAATEGEMGRLQKNIGTASSPNQLKGYLETAVGVLGSKLSSLNYQYHQAMGDKDPFIALSPDAKAILTKHGFDAEHPEIGGGPKTVRMRAPNGQEADVPADQVEAAKAKGAKVIGG